MSREISLKRGTMHRIEGGRGTRIHVREGEVWLTQHLDWRDRILIAGESFVLDREGPAIASALRNSVFNLSRPRAGRGVLSRAWSALTAPLAELA